MEETARLEARMQAIESRMMMQSGALSSAKEQAEAHREELTRMMRDLHETIVHTAALHAKVEETKAEARPTPRVPPGFQGADLRVTATKAPVGQGPDDPWSAVAGCSSADPWANSQLANAVLGSNVSVGAALLDSERFWFNCSESPPWGAAGRPDGPYAQYCNANASFNKEWFDAITRKHDLTTGLVRSVFGDFIDIE